MVGEAMVRAAASLRDIGEPVRLGLTGGRDSRIVLAALLAAGVPTTAFTKRHPDNADVVLARGVAEVAGVAHERTEPETPSGEGVLVDPDLRMRQCLVYCDGQISAFDASGTLGTRYSPATTVLSGAGGEILRGGYASMEVAPKTPNPGSRWIRAWTTGPRSALLRPEVRRAYQAQAQAQGWIAAVDSDPMAGLDRYYLHERTARWGGAARQGNTLAGTPRTPFLDDGVLVAAYAVAPALRAGEAQPWSNA